MRYEKLYPGIDLRLREMNGVPEYDLLLQPGAELSRVSVRVEGAQGLSIARDGSLVIATALGPLAQFAPKTWQVDQGGRTREVECNFTLLGPDRFGFAAPEWDGDTCLTIDPGLIWSTYLGGRNADYAHMVDVDARGVVTVVGETGPDNFPTTRGAYDTSHNSARQADAFVTRLDPSKTGTAQLVYSTYLGGNGFDAAYALSVDTGGVVTLAGVNNSGNFPTTSGAYQRTHNGGGFISRLDPRKTGAAQLVYSTYLGGSGWEQIDALSVDAGGAVTVLGSSNSTNFPTTRGAYQTTNNGRYDAFVSCLDPRKAGSAQLVYSTYLGGAGEDFSAYRALSVDTKGVVTVMGTTNSPKFPTTSGAYDTTYNGVGGDAFVSRLDPSKSGTAQLVYSTFLGGTLMERASALCVAPGGSVTVVGMTESKDFPTTGGAYDTTYNGGLNDEDVFVSRLDPSKSGRAQLVYSTFLGAKGPDRAYDLSVDADGVVTLVGSASTNFPATRGAYQTTNRYWNAFVSRLDPRQSGGPQLVYSTFLGGSFIDVAFALFVDASGVATVAGNTFKRTDFPTTTGAFDRTFNGGRDAFVSRLDMGVALYGDVHEIPIKTGGSQKLTVNAGKAYANKRYWIFGSETGTSPGLDLLGVHIPLNPDLYTVIAMGAVNGKEFTRFRGTLDADGLASASFNLPAKLPLPPGFTLRHAYVIYDASGNLYMASNAVPVRLR